MILLKRYSKVKYSSNVVRSYLKNINNLPKAYQQGWVEFYKLKFKVTPDVLIPRPETELLVDEVLNFVKNLSPATCNLSPLVILDLGTGAGNIAISIAKNLRKQLPTRQVGTRIIASDISKKALKLAKQNAKLHGVEDKIKFIKSNLLSAFCHSGGRRPIESNKKDAIAQRQAPLIASLQHDNPNIIVTNLPYIPSARIPYLDSSVKDFEPRIALDGGEDGFELYRKLFKQINQNGWVLKLLIGEIDYTHGELAVNEAQKYFPDAEVEIKTDLAKKQRILQLHCSV